MTVAARDCYNKKYDWCVASWRAQLEDANKRYDNRKDLLTRVWREEVSRCDQAKLSCERQLADAKAWYRNPWFAGAVGAVVGAVLTGATVYAVLR